MQGADPQTDEQLLEVVRRGGPEGRRAYDELVRRHQAWLVRMLTYVLRSQSLAEDVAQEALIRAYERLPAGGDVASFRAWIRTVATRLAFNARRDAATRRRYQDQAPGARPPSGLEERAAAKDTVLALLDELPYAYREILVLRHVEELEVKEIARLLDLGESAAKMRLKRARDAFLAAHEKLDVAT